MEHYMGEVQHRAVVCEGSQKAKKLNHSVA